MAVERREKMVGYVRRGEESESDVEVGCRWRLGSTASRNVKMVVERREKYGGKVRRGEESESDVVVGVSLEVRLHRFKKR